MKYKKRRKDFCDARSNTNNVCLICFEWFDKPANFNATVTSNSSGCHNNSELGSDQEVTETAATWASDNRNHEGDDEAQTVQEIHSPPDLYLRFLTFITRHLGLRSSGNELLKNAKTKKDLMGEGVQPFCGKCQDSVELLCDLFRDLEELQMRLSWRLSELGSQMNKGPKSTSKLRKMILNKLKKELNAPDPGFVEGLRKKVVQKCKWKAKKLYCGYPQVHVHRGLNPDLWKFSYSDTEDVLKRLIAVCLLASSELTSDTKPPPLSGKISNSNIKEESSMDDEANESVGDAFSPPAFDNDDDGSDFEKELQEMALTSEVNDDSSNPFESEGEGVAPLKRLRRTRRSRSKVLSTLGGSEEPDPDKMTLDDDWEPDTKRKRKMPIQGKRRGRRPKKELGEQGQEKESLEKSNKDVTVKRRPGPRKTGRRCKECSEVFENAPAMFKHRRKVHNLVMCKLECPVCFKTVVSEERYKAHMKRHEKNGIKEVEKYFCEVCGKTLYKQSSLDEHLKEDHDGMYKCLQPNCDSAYNSSQGLREHLDNVHNNVEDSEKKFCCTYCFRGFATRQYFNIHRRTIHDEKRFFCDKIGCFVQCESNEDLKAHIKTHGTAKAMPTKTEEGHDGGNGDNKDEVKHDDVFCCPICDRSFYDVYNMKLHSLLHTPHVEDGRTGYECSECRFHVRYVDTLVGHFDYRHGLYRNKWYAARKIATKGRQKRRMVECEFCLKTFPTYAIKRHRLTHDINRKTGEKEHVCHSCGAAYLLKTSLYAHIRKKHDESKPKPKPLKFECEICKRKLSDKWKLKKHLLTHDPDRKPCAVCPICGMAYITKCGLQDHIRSKHENVTFPCKECGKVFTTDSGLVYHRYAKHIDDALKRFTCRFCGKKEHRSDLHRQHEKRCGRIHGAGESGPGPSQEQGKVPASAEKETEDRRAQDEVMTNLDVKADFIPK